MYKQLDNAEKFKYFKNNTLLKIISKNSKLKSFITIFILSPLIKINYLIISALIYLSYALCENELDNILLQNGFSKSYESINEEYSVNPIVNFKENKDKLNNHDNASIGNNSPTSLKSDIDLFMSMIKLNETKNFENIKVTDTNMINNEINEILESDSLDNIINCKIYNSTKNVNDDLINQNELQENKEKEYDDLRCLNQNITNEEINNENLSEYITTDYNEQNNDTLDEYVLYEDVLDKNSKKEVKKIYNDNEIQDNTDLNKINEINEINEIKELNKKNQENETKESIIDKNEQNEIILIEEVDFGDYMSNLISKSDEKLEKEALNKQTINTMPSKIKIGKKKL